MRMFSEMLSQGSRKEIGRATEVASIIFESPPLLEALLDCIVEGNETVRSHGAHALMQVGTKSPEILTPYQDRILGDLLSLEQWEIQEQLLKILPGLDVPSGIRNLAVDHCRRQLNHKAAFVRTCALQAMVDFSRNDPALRDEARLLLKQAVKTGAKSMQARARHLLEAF